MGKERNRERERERERERKRERERESIKKQAHNFITTGQKRNKTTLNLTYKRFAFYFDFFSTEMRNGGKVNKSYRDRGKETFWEGGGGGGE